MNTAITFFAGSLTFVLMMGLKIPIKKLSRFLSKGQTVYYKRWNLLVILAVVVVATVCYYLVLLWLGDTHFKFCCALKAAAVAMAFYAVYEQIV